MNELKALLPYLVSILTALLAFFASILVCKKNNKAEIEKLKSQQEFELQRMQKDYESKLELMKQEYALKTGADVITGFVSKTTEALYDSPTLKSEINKRAFQTFANKKSKKNGRK